MMALPNLPPPDAGQIAIIVVMVSYIFTIVYIEESRKRKFRVRKKNFFRALTEGLKNGLILTFEDLENLHRSLPTFGPENINSRRRISRYLTEYFGILVSKNKDYITNDIDISKISEWKERISGFIKKNEEISPYSELPEVEKSILNDILAFSEKNDSDSIKRKLAELANTIKVRADDLKKVRSSNKMSTIFTIAGAALTIIFGIIAFVK